MPDSTAAGVPYPLSTDAVSAYPSVGRALADWIEHNTVRTTDSRLTGPRPPETHSHPISDISGLQETLDRAGFTRDTLPSTNLDNIRQSGAYSLAAPFPVGFSNVPPGMVTAGTLLVATDLSYGWGMQIITQIGVSPRIWWRSSNNISAWNPWIEIMNGDRPIQSATNVDEMRGTSWAGTWQIGSATVANTLSGTRPAGEWNWLPGQIQVIGGSGSARLSTQIYTPYAAIGFGGTTKVFVRTISRFSMEGGNAWSEWLPLHATGVSAEDLDELVPVNALALGGRDLRLQLFRDEYPLVSTEGRGVVVFRYDHGLTNFKDVLLPLHQKYDLPAYIAMNSRNWGLAENSGATMDEAKSWGRVEWGNHSATHDDSAGIADIYDNIVNGRIELEQQLGRTIHGFTVPGVVGLDNFDGFHGGYYPGYSNTYAGSLIMSHHAICSGVVGAIQRPLDGIVRIGTRHKGWEKSTFNEVKALIDEAITGKTALTLMQHPRTMNLPGYWTPELADQVLEHVRSRIDAGDLADITYYQSHHATL